jgi:hypothetical protein
MATGIIRIQTSLLMDLLLLPEQYNAVSVRQSATQWVNGYFEFLASSPDIPEVPEGADFPLVDLKHRLTEKGSELADIAIDVRGT